MNKDFFAEQISRLEKIFNRGQQLEDEVLDEYFTALRHFREVDFIHAIDDVIQTHHPDYGHIFPPISTILDALNDVMKNRSWGSSEDRRDIDFCERCRNGGKYLEGNTAKFCDCIHGRKKAITFRFWPDRKKIIEEQGKIKNAAPAYRGLKERNPLGFFEDTQEEHDRWMVAKRAENVEIKARAEARERRLAAEKRTVPRESLKRLVEETLSQVQMNRPETEREPGEDEVPF